MSDKFEIIICGGGLAGVSAAIGAAREGKSVLLIEQNACLGGMATSGLVNPFMSYMLHDGSGKLVNGGIFKDIIDSLDELGGLHENRITFNEVIMKLVLDKLVKKYGVHVLFYSKIIRVGHEKRKVKSVDVANQSGIQAFSADYFVDATGDGNVYAMSGCKYKIGRDEDGFCQPMTLCFRLGNVDKNRMPERAEINRIYNEFQNQGKIKNIRENVLFMNHMLDDVIHFNTTRIIKKSPLSAEDMSEVEFESRAQMLEMFKFLRDNIRGFENAQLLMAGDYTGIRESRRLSGEYVINEADLLSCKKFEDSVVRGNYEIDIHNPSGTGTCIKNIAPNDYYTIPYRSLIPTDMDNLLAAGRCISATHEAHSAYRIMPICCNIGEAAGIAAAEAAEHKIPFKAVMAKNIQDKLKKNHALF